MSSYVVDETEVYMVNNRIQMIMNVNINGILETRHADYIFHFGEEEFLAGLIDSFRVRFKEFVEGEEVKDISEEVMSRIFPKCFVTMYRMIKGTL